MNDKKAETPDLSTVPQMPTRTIQLLGVPPNLVNDIRDQLRNSGTHKEVDGLLNQLAQCQVLDVQVAAAPAQPPGG